ncbi:MAG: Uncharacterized protein YyaL, partial [uncultured Solirubrobacteraceae bacterium]
ERSRERNESLPPPAQGQPRRLAAVGRGGVAPRARGGQAAAGLDRLQRLPLVPRDGARVVRGRGDGRGDERPLRVREGRPRGAPRRRRALHGGRPGDDRSRRLAAQRVHHARAGAVLRRHVLPAAAARRHAELAAGAARRRRRVADQARRDHPGGRAHGPAAAGRRAAARVGGAARRPRAR